MVTIILWEAQAAFHLYFMTKEEKYQDMAKYLLAQNLRLAYWYQDKTKPVYEHYNMLGMFQACTPMLYPAFFENMHTIAMLSTVFRHIEPMEGMLRLFNLARINNFYFFPKCLPHQYHTSELMYIPFENLGMLEDDKTGYAGQEIYGCGGVFWAHLLWEALAQCENREQMIMNLNLFDQDNEGKLKDIQWNFLIYNPLEERVHAKIDFPYAQSGDRAFVGPTIDTLSMGEVRMAQSAISIDIQPDSYQYIAIKRNA